MWSYGTGCHLPRADDGMGDDNTVLSASDDTLQQHWYNACTVLAQCWLMTATAHSPHLALKVPDVVSDGECPQDLPPIPMHPCAGAPPPPLSVLGGAKTHHHHSVGGHPVRPALGTRTRGARDGTEPRCAALLPRTRPPSASSDALVSNPMPLPPCSTGPSPTLTGMRRWARAVGPSLCLRVHDEAIGPVLL